jgi:purine-binding chemotaxis protein CheW
MNALSTPTASGTSLSVIAARPPAAATASHPIEVLCFKVGQEQYGVDILQVQEIRRFEAPTRLHGTPDGVLGVLDLRGEIVPLIDARTYLGTPAHFDDSTLTVVFHFGDRQLGLVVDAVADVVEVQARNLGAAPWLGGYAKNGGLSGLTTLADGSLMILLDAKTLLPTLA